MPVQPKLCPPGPPNGRDTAAVALNPVNFPVPSENVHRPEGAMSVQWPNALLLPGPGGSRIDVAAQAFRTSRRWR